MNLLSSKLFKNPWVGIWASVILLALGICAFLLIPKPAQALSGSQFNAGNIISNNVFFNGSSMSTQQIQNFLNAKVPSCDTNGTKTHSSGQTRAQYGTSRGYPPPYTCLKSYTQSTPSKGAETSLCSAYTGGTKSAAQIINDVAKACGVSPKVLLVLLQKEQSLVTDDWPWSIQYRSATGFGCPDTAPCDSEYYGFFNQVYNAARIYKKYARDSHLYNYRANRNNTILWHPNASCGNSTVYIENQATAGLYVYTPYRPNQAALNNLYGTGDGCSSYGNRNFWRMFNDWFGSTQLASLPGCQQATNTTLACVWKLRDLTGRQMLLAPLAERDALVNNSNYIFEGAMFFGNVNIAPKTGNVPIYRLISPAGTNLLTTDSNEKNVLAANGWENKGIDFYADPAGANSGYPIYRLFSSSLGAHAFAASTQERDGLVAAGYTYEGVAFSSISAVRQETAPPAGQALVYRFSSMPGNSHFYTTAIGERDSMIQAGYRYERVAWKSSSTPTSVPIYRLYSASMRKHLYTTDVNEKNILSQTGSWKYEGVSQYMSPTPTAKPVYRLYSPITTNHFWTASKYEHDVLVQAGTFRSEGIAWYQP